LDIDDVDWEANRSLREEIGSSIKALRENLGWSQLQLARKIPLSQKQISRIENQQVADIPRATLIRLAEVLAIPVMTGELNRWLYIQGYRQYVCPRLPLPPQWDHLLARYDPYPAVLVDVGGYLAAINRASERLLAECNRSIPRGSHLVVELCRPNGRLSGLIHPSNVPGLVRRLLWEWSFHADEPWVSETDKALTEQLGQLWTDLARQYVPDPNFSPPAIEALEWAIPSAPGSRFLGVEMQLRHRPDLRLLVYYPLNSDSEKWCLNQSSV
jgi:DNA-binding XRE family transcriptional regulator